MTVAELVMRFVEKLAPGQAFVTKQLLFLSKRGALDQALARLVKRGNLIRLARGVFCLNDPNAALPDLLEVVRVKAQAFGKTIAIHGLDALKSLLGQGGNNEITFACNGRSSSFVALGKRVYLRGTSMIRVKAGDAKTGLVIRALAQLKRKNVSGIVLPLITKDLSINERLEMRRVCSPMMTGWMADFLLHSGSLRRNSKTGS